MLGGPLEHRPEALLAPLAKGPVWPKILGERDGSCAIHMAGDTCLGPGHAALHFHVIAPGFGSLQICLVTT